MRWREEKDGREGKGEGERRGRERREGEGEERREGDGERKGEKEMEEGVRGGGRFEVRKN